MSNVITYGTFDLLHQGHYNILKKAKEQGDYLIVGVTSENYDKTRGKLNVKQSLIERIENVRSTGLADEIIVEEYLGQKIDDIKKYNIDKFVIGSDWLGKFDYLKEYCEVIYMERTKGVSSTQLRESEFGMLKLGIVGAGRIAKRFCAESKFVSGVDVDYVFGRNDDKLKEFAEQNDLNFYTTDYNKFLDKVQAVYIATPHLTHYQYVKEALMRQKHVICEKPIVLKEEEARELYQLAKENNVVLVEAIKTAYAPAFNRLVCIAKSGIIGEIKDVDATFTKLVEGDLRELDAKQAGGSVTELATYPLIAIIKLLGTQYEDIQFYSYMDKKRKVDLYTKILLKYKNAIATAQVGLGVKKDGNLTISGTKGYIFVPAPWWKTEYFEVKFENQDNNTKDFYKFEGDGLRYELAEFVNCINKNRKNLNLKEEESICIARIIEEYREQLAKEI